MKPSIFAVTAKCNQCDYECTITPHNFVVPKHKVVVKHYSQGETTMKRTKMDCSGSGARYLELLRDKMRIYAEMSQEQARKHLHEAERCRAEAEQLVAALKTLEGKR